MDNFEKTTTELLNEFLRTKDKELLGILYQRMKGCLFQKAVEILQNNEEAEDIIQDVFCKLYEIDPHPIKSADLFLFKMTENMAIDLYRHIHGCAFLPYKTTKSTEDKVIFSSLEEMINSDNDDGKTDLKYSKFLTDKKLSPVEIEFQKKLLLIRIQSALKQLPENQREAVELYYSRDFSRAEVAEILKVNEQTAESLYQRGLAILRNALVPKNEQPKPRPRRKPIQALDPDSKEVKFEYSSITQALESAGGSGRYLREALKRGSTYRGQVWRYANAV